MTDTVDALAYDVAACVPRMPQYMADFRIQSRRTRESLPQRADLGYGPHPRQRLDYFGAARSGPVMAFFHGGYWQGCDKHDFSCVVEPYVAAGYDVAMVNYPLVPDARLGQTVQSCREAVAWLARDIAATRGGPADIVCVGHSAGGHLAATVAMTPPDGLEGRIAGLCAVSGIYELSPLTHLPVNAVLQLDANDCAALSPLRAARALPCILAVGEDDPEGFRWQYSAMTAHVRAKAMIMPGQDHFMTFQSMARRDGPITALLLGMLNSAIA